jgi:hypothetical protein
LSDDDYVELYVLETNLVKEDYINAIKIYTEKFSHIWVIPQVVSINAEMSGFSGYDIETIIAEMVPIELQPLFERVKNQLNNR